MTEIVIESMPQEKLKKVKKALKKLSKQLGFSYAIEEITS